jgi:hypothetical protein
MIGFDRLTYTAGNEHNPTDPFGRTILVVEATGAVQLDHHQRTGSAAYSSQLEPAVLVRLGTALRASSFPHQPRDPIPPDSLICLLVVELDGVQQRASFAWQAARQQGYDELLDVLDGLLRELAGSTAR